LDILGVRNIWLFARVDIGFFCALYVGLLCTFDVRFLCALNTRLLCTFDIGLVDAFCIRSFLFDIVRVGRVRLLGTIKVWLFCVWSINPFDIGSAIIVSLFSALLWLLGLPILRFESVTCLGI